MAAAPCAQTARVRSASSTYLGRNRHLLADCIVLFRSNNEQIDAMANASDGAAFIILPSTPECENGEATGSSDAICQETRPSPAGALSSLGAYRHTCPRPSWGAVQTHRTSSGDSRPPSCLSRPFRLLSKNCRPTAPQSGWCAATGNPQAQNDVGSCPKSRRRADEGLLGKAKDRCGQNRWRG